MHPRLPSADFLDLIRPSTGEIFDAQPAARGFSSDVLTLIDSDLGRFFVKGIKNRAGGRRDSLLRERIINPSVHPLSPRLCWHAQNDQWIALGFEQLNGRPSNFAPNSPDLPAIMQLVNRIGEIPLPAAAELWPETRWDRFASDPHEAALFKGDSLIHGDINPGNLLIGDTGSWVVDWAWPTRGSALIDPALLALQLIAAGHSPQDAETWTSQCTAWTHSDPAAIDAFARANLRMYRKRAKRYPDQTWLAAMETTARAWTDYRQASSPSARANT
ncbi:protein kinase [Streptomyces sp. NPDC051214]|uniref:protein kinase n=1 Tax=Streptomyces sp. NPDC051214 TaxID=3155282 RepID=UPI00341D4F73